MRRYGLTLVELLVVISIIAILMVLAMAPARTCREYARDIACRSNLKQLSLAFSTYETSFGTYPLGFNGLMPMEPPEPGFAGNHVCDKPGWWWFNYIGLNDYKKNKSALWCPSRKTNNPVINNVLNGNYGVNQSICKLTIGKFAWAEIVGKPLNLMDIKSPSRTVLLLDCGYATIAWWHVTDEPPFALSLELQDAAYVPGMHINPDKELREGQFLDALDGRHRKKHVNVAYVDSHVESLQAEDLFISKDANDYINLHPLWRPK